MQYPRVEEVATQKIIKLDVTAMFKDAIKLITEKGIRNIVVTDEELDLYAYIGVDEIVKYSGKKTPMDTPLSALGLHPLIVIPRRYDVFDASALFLDDISLLGISNDDGSLFGVVSHFDILSIGARMSEHIMDSPVEALVFSHNVLKAEPHIPLDALLPELGSSSMDCVIVQQEGRPMGIVTKRDVTRLLSEEKPISRPVRDYMSAPLVTFRHDISIREALSSVQEHHHKRIIVVRDDGTLHGVITEKALINLIYSRLAQKTAIGIDRFNQLLEKKLQDKFDENDLLKERYELALLASSDGVWDWNLETGEVVFSEYWQHNFSDGSAEMSCSADIFLQKVHPADRERWNKVRLHAIEAGHNKFDHEYRLLGKEDEPLWVKDRAVILYNERGTAYRIVATTANMSENIEMRQALESYKEMVEHHARHDILTGLPNRVYFSEMLNEYLGRTVHGLAVCFVDIDRFKEINESFGHIMGDYIMKYVAERISRLLDDSDMIARFGGDEFVIILNEISDPLEVIEFVQKLVEVMHEPFSFNENRIYLTLSIGIALYPDDGTTSDKLLSNATAAMNKAKNAGRNTYKFYTKGMTDRAYEYVIMDSNVREALEHDEFILHFQPQIDASSGRPTGAEALLRWQQKGHGLVPPDKFIPFLEESGLIIPVGKWILKAVMTQVAAWYQQGFNPGVIAVNISMVQLKEYDFIEFVQQTLTATGCKPQWLEFEITESRVMQDPAQDLSLLKQIRNLGIQLAIDDFGTGHSSLSYLKRLPINKLKIDRSFVTDVPGCEEDVAIVKAIIALADSMGLEVIAEGIETEAQKDFLLDNGCVNHQGYFYTRPVSAEEIGTLFASPA